VTFRSHPTPPVDETVVDVMAACVLSAVLEAKRVVLLHHGWTFVRAVPWPSYLTDVNDALVAGRRR
jgi:hypothetical protein